MSDTDNTINWNLTTWKGNRQEQMSRAAKMPFDVILDAIEEMAVLAADLARQADNHRSSPHLG